MTALWALLARITAAGVTGVLARRQERGDHVGEHLGRCPALAQRLEQDERRTVRRPRHLVGEPDSSYVDRAVISRVRRLRGDACAGGSRFTSGGTVSGVGVTGPRPTRHGARISHVVLAVL
ncbi:hypothetical protein [Streptomyces griseus]|uniref:hypothetical protein n=1 Tax=Streptomyces griseus TaxID=1911 RepID=UPI0008402C23|nr:hypothetical protein [Streptomyces griseus]